MATGALAGTGSRATERAGFSTIDILVVMFVMVIAAGVVIPSYSDPISTVRLDTTSKILAFELEGAKMKAISKSTPMAVQYGGTTMQLKELYLGSFVNSGVPRQLTDKANFSTSGTIVFLASGMAQNPATIVIQDGRGQTRTIDVSISGRIKVQ